MPLPLRKLGRALSRFGPLTDVWQVETVQSATTITVSLWQRPNPIAGAPGVAPYIGTSVQPDYVGALVRFDTGVLSGITQGQGVNAYGAFTTTIQSIVSTTNPAVTTVTFADAMPTPPQTGDLLTVIRNLRNGATVDVNGAVTATIDTSGGPVDMTGPVTVENDQVPTGESYIQSGAITIAAGTYSTGTILGDVSVTILPAGTLVSNANTLLGAISSDNGAYGFQAYLQRALVGSANASGFPIDPSINQQQQAGSGVLLDTNAPASPQGMIETNPPYAWASYNEVTVTLAAPAGGITIPSGGITVTVYVDVQPTNQTLLSGQPLFLGGNPGVVTLAPSQYTGSDVAPGAGAAVSIGTSGGQLFVRGTVFFSAANSSTSAVTGYVVFGPTTSSTQNNVSFSVPASATTDYMVVVHNGPPSYTAAGGGVSSAVITVPPCTSLTLSSGGNTAISFTASYALEAE